MRYRCRLFESYATDSRRLVLIRDSAPGKIELATGFTWREEIEGGMFELSDGIERADRIAERAHLLLAHAAERSGKEREHHRTVSQRVAERHVLAILVRQREIGRLGAHVYGHLSSLTLRRLLADAVRRRVLVERRSRRPLR